MLNRVQLRRAVHALRAGEVIAYPTESVWGLGCDPDDGDAVSELLRMKRRSSSLGLILVASTIEQFDPYLEGLHWSVRSRLIDSWPGPVTWLVPDNGRASEWIIGRHDSVALRVSAHPTVQALCSAFGGPVVSTSANRTGREPIRHAWRLRAVFGRDLAAVAPGALGGAARPTPIRDVIDGALVRG